MPSPVTVVAPLPGPREPLHPIPHRLPTVMMDRSVALLSHAGDMQIHGIIRFDGRLEEARLARALRLLADAEPVTGARFRNRAAHPYWERRVDLDRCPLCTLVETDDQEAALEAYMISPSTPERDPVVQARILRGERDLLCLKVQHEAMDGGGSKACAYRLSELYRALGRDPNHRPQPNLKGRRCYEPIWEQFGFLDRRRIWRQQWQCIHARTNPKRWWVFPHDPEVSGDAVPGRAYVFRRIGAEQFRQLKAYGKDHDATVNDVVNAALLAALIEHIEPAEDVPLRLRNTVDLRRYLPDEQGEALCNLAAFVYPNMGPGRPPDFPSLLGRARDEMNRKKAGYIGLGEARMMTVFERGIPFPWFDHLMSWAIREMSPSEEMLTPTLTNIGRVFPDRLDFGEPGVTDAAFTASVAYPPNHISAVTGYGESLTFSTGFCEGGTPRPVAQKFLDRIADYLPGGAAWSGDELRFDPVE